MASLAVGLAWDHRRKRAVSSLEGLLRTYPEGVASIVALDRLVDQGLSVREAMEALDTLRDSGRIDLRHGRWIIL